MLIPRSVQHVAALAARETTRYTIQGVHLCYVDGRPHAVTTDSRRLIVASWDPSPVKDYPPVPGCNPAPVPGWHTIVPLDLWREAFKALPRRTPKPILEHVAVDETALPIEPGKDGTQPLVLATHNGEGARVLQGFAVDGRFPVWSDFIPKPSAKPSAKGCPLIGLNPRYLADCALAVACVVDWQLANKRPMRLCIPDAPSKPIVLEASNPEGIRVTCVLMPMNLH